MKYYLIFLLLSFSIVIYPQQSDVLITGLVTDSNNEPLPGVTVQIDKTQFATVTDINGRYHLRGKWLKGATIVFSFIGKKAVKMEYFGQEEQDAAMQDDPKFLKEIVVTPKQNINEIDIRGKTGVIQEVDMRRLNSKPMMDLSLALQGSIPGLVVTNTGDLGSKPEIRIRGNSSFRKGDNANEPLYILDGQVISSDAFMTLNPMDIKEIKVLKDAIACALYGIKAANGVLEITSKRGVADGGVRVSYDFNMGVTTRGRRGVKMMNTEEKLELERLLQNEKTPGYIHSEEYIRKINGASPNIDEFIAKGKIYLDSLKTINTDWFEELMRTSIYQRHNLSVRGGTEETSYYASVNFAEQGGRIPGNDIRRFAVNLSLDQKVAKIGYVSLRATAGYSKADTPNGSDYSPTSLVYDLNPYETRKSIELISYPGMGYNDLINQYSQTSIDKRGGLTGSINIEPLKGLKLDAVAGIDFILNETQSFTPSTSYSEQHIGKPDSELGHISKAKNTSTNISSNIRLTYNISLAEKHNITIGANMDYNLADIDNISISGYGVGTNNFPAAINKSITGTRKPDIGSTLDKTAQMGFGAILGYSYNSIYDLLLTYKADASSVLPKDKRWNAAWAVGLGWNINQYPFLKDNKIISNLNLKGSFGKIANLSGVSRSSTIGVYSYSDSYYGDSRILYLQSLYNPDLKPEQTKSVDLGLTIELMKIFTLGANIYHRQTDDALLDVPIPPSNGFSLLKRNIGVLRNEGIELSTFIKVLNTEDWRLTLRTSLAYNRSKVVDLYYGNRIYESEESLIPEYEIGKPYNMIYGLKSLGINPYTGAPVFEGADGREISAIQKYAVKKDDIIALGHRIPPYNGSINISLSYKHFDLDIDFYYVIGGKVVYDEKYVRMRDDANRNAISDQLNDMWIKVGDEGKKYYSPFLSSSTYALIKDKYTNSRKIGKSDYLKMSMLSLRYRISQEFLKKNCDFIKYSNISFQASNLFMITPFRGADPESGSLVGGQSPVFTVNMNVTF